jgi:hypothetical protein
MRRSRHKRYFPHFVWSPDGRLWWGYSPSRPDLVRDVLGLWFRGSVKLETVAHIVDHVAEPVREPSVNRAA